MSKLYNMGAAFSEVENLYGITPDVDSFEDVAMAGWELIGNKHTRLYRYMASTENKELALPCNVDEIVSVHVPCVDVSYTNVRKDYGDPEAYMIESYIDLWKQASSPFSSKGKLVDYNEGDGVLYFPRDYCNVKVIYKGVLADDEGLPLLNQKELKAVASFVAWRTLYKDGLKKRDGNVLKLAQDVEREWLRRCNAARIKEHLSQNEMNAILDVKTRWDRKIYGKSFKPTD